MRDKITRILLIDDDPGDVEILREMLRESEPIDFRLDTAERLSIGMKRLAEGGIDVVLLDLGLPDSQGLETVERYLGQSPDVPVVVMTGLEDEAMATEALRKGAQDYLVKGGINSGLLVRAVRYSLERHRLNAELEKARARAEQERERRSLERLSGPSGTPVTGRLFGEVSLRQGYGEDFRELVEGYRLSMDQALEQRIYKVEYPVSERLRSMADRIGFLRGGPRDVVDIYNSAMKTKLDDMPPKKAQLYMAEARIMALELMGYLAAYYRMRAR